MVKDQPIQHERTAVVYSSYSLSRECQIYETEETRLYWKDFVLGSAIDCALTKASQMDLT